MAQYSILKKTDVFQLLAPYGIFEVSSFEILGGGSENTNYKVVTEIGTIVLTICEQKQFEEVHNLTQLLEYLELHHFSTSKLIRTKNNEPLLVYKGKPYMVKKFIEGKIMSNLPEHLLEQIGAHVAKLHQIKAPNYLTRVMWCDKERFHEVEAYALNSSFDIWLKDILHYINSQLTPDLPKALIHSDIFDNNVIVNHTETQATIMDFEESTYYFRIFDLGMLFIGLCIENNTLNFFKAAAILKGYTTHIPLTKKEQEILQPVTVYAAAGVAFWRHKNFNYTIPSAELKDTYLEMKNLADTIRVLDFQCLAV